jgi:hypothetical protein
VFLEDIFRHTSNPDGFNVYRRIIDESATLTGSYYTSALLLYTFQPDGLAGRGIVFLEDIFRHTSNPDGIQYLE